MDGPREEEGKGRRGEEERRGRESHPTFCKEIAAAGIRQRLV